MSSHTPKNSATKPASLLVRAMAGIFLVFLLLPLIAIGTTTTPAEILTALKDPLVWPAVRISIVTTAISFGITLAFGTPLSWLLARSRSRWARACESLLELPIVLPPAVIGVALLLAYGRRGWLGGVFESLGWSPGFSLSAVIFAQLVVAAPFFIQSATAAFRQVDDELLIVARTLGASPMRTFLRVAVPLALPGLLNGAALMWARALGEFGATLFFAGNLSGRTQTMPLAIYAALESDLRVAQAMSVLLVAVAILLLSALRGPIAAKFGPYRHNGELQ
ncbi:ABC transporter permease [Bradymonas sediminis]|nr:ABC transporter permease [Bradymonas sediminis]TDP75711.1 molybdate transport system permease protein [Bradymonas sediminis]